MILIKKSRKFNVFKTGIKLDQEGVKKFVIFVLIVVMFANNNVIVWNIQGKIVEKTVFYNSNVVINVKNYVNNNLALLVNN